MGPRPWNLGVGQLPRSPGVYLRPSDKTLFVKGWGKQATPYGTQGHAIPVSDGISVMIWPVTADGNLIFERDPLGTEVPMNVFRYAVPNRSEFSVIVVDFSGPFASSWMDLTDVPMLFTGSDSDDFVIGSTGNDTIVTGKGSDQISGRDGDDVIIAGSGNDTIYFGRGKDTLVADDGGDTLIDYTAGEDVVMTPDVAAKVLKLLKR